MANIATALRFPNQWTSAAELHVSPEQERFKPLLVKHLLKTVTNGLQRGTIAEIHGIRSAGTTSISWHLLAEATRHGEICAVIDVTNSFDPTSASAAGIDLARLVWIRCNGDLEAAMRAADLLLHAGGFGVIHLDLLETSVRSLYKIPVSYWHRFRRAIEHSATILLVSANTPQARSCAALSLEIRLAGISWSGSSKFTVLRGIKNVLTRPGRVAPLTPHVLFLKAA